jgi:hypothetical protein
MPTSAHQLPPGERIAAEIEATVARTAPAVLGVLADGAPRTRAAIVEALAGRHEREDVIVTLLRLGATGAVRGTGDGYVLPRTEP